MAQLAGNLLQHVGQLIEILRLWQDVGAYNSTRTLSCFLHQKFTFSLVSSQTGTRSYGQLPPKSSRQLLKTPAFSLISSVRLSGVGHQLGLLGRRSAGQTHTTSSLHRSSTLSHVLPWHL